MYSERYDSRNPRTNRLSGDPRPVPLMTARSRHRSRPNRFQSRPNRFLSKSSRSRSPRRCWRRWTWWSRATTPPRTSATYPWRRSSSTNRYGPTILLCYYIKPLLFNIINCYVKCNECSVKLDFVGSKPKAVAI